MAGQTKESVVKARLDGVDDVTGGFQKIGRSAEEAGGKVGKGWKDAGAAIRDSVTGVVTDIAHVVNAATAINFAGSVAQVHQLEDSVARMAVATDRGFDAVKSSVNALSTDINELPIATAAWESSIGKVTYNYESAAAAARDAAGYGAKVGETVQEVQPLVIALEELTGASGKSGQALGVIVAQARELGTVGGPKSVGDQVEHLRGQLSYLAGDVEKASALVAGFGGTKGFTPQQRERALGGVLSRVEGNIEGFQRHLGKQLTDEFGHITDMTGVIEELQKYGRKGKGQRFRLEQTFGREATAAIMHTDIAAVRAAETLPPAVDELERARQQMRDSAAGQRKAAEVKKAQTMADTVGAGSTLGDFSDWLGQQSAAHPILTGVGTAIGTGLLGKGIAGAFNVVGKGLAGWFGGGAAAGGGGMAAAGGGAGGAGFGTGMLTPGLGLGLGGIGAGILGFSYWAGNQNEGLVRQLEESDRRQALAAREGQELRRSTLHRQRGEMVIFGPGKTPGAPNQAAGAEHDVPMVVRQGSGPTPPALELRSLLEGLVKAGASLQLAQETAARTAQAGQQPVQIEVINMTGGEVEARERGRQ